MGKQDKLEAKLLSKPKDFTWKELCSLLAAKGFEEFAGNGSRRKFVHQKTKLLINLHEPHPQPILKAYMVKQVVEKLKELEMLEQQGDSNE